MYSVNPDGTGITPFGVTCGTGELFGPCGPAYSPDGRQIAYVSLDNADDEGTPCNREIHKVNVDGTGDVRLTNDPTGSCAPDDFDPAWSPDGGQIAFTVNPPLDVYVMNAGGAGRTALAAAPRADLEPAWSPDGTKIVFSTDRHGTFDRSNFELYTMNPDGTGLTRLTDSADSEFSPSWSPDGTRIAFSRTTGPTFDSSIYLMNANGTGETRLTTTGRDYSPAWSPDGTKLAFSSSRDGIGKIYVMNADGSDQTAITNGNRWDSEPDWQPLPGPRRGDYKNAAKYCKAEREFLGDSAFRQKYGGRANAHGKCVSGK